MYTESEANARVSSLLNTLKALLEDAGLVVDCRTPQRLEVKNTSEDKYGVRVEGRPNLYLSRSFQPIVNIGVSAFGVYLGTHFPNRLFKEDSPNKMINPQKVVEKVLKGLALAKALKDEQVQQEARRHARLSRARILNARAKLKMYQSKIYVDQDGHLHGFNHLILTNEQILAILEFTKHLLGLPDAEADPE